MANRRTAPVPPTGAAARDIGGAIVRRRFTFGGIELKSGHVMTAGEVAAIPRNNFNSLRDNGFLETFPPARPTHLENVDAEVEYHTINRGFGLWDVIEGKKINNKPLTKAQADDLMVQKGLEQGVPNVPINEGTVQVSPILQN